MQRRLARVGPVLDAFLARSDPIAAVRNDPVELARAFASPEDREVAAFVAASLAFGRVHALRAKVGVLLAALGPEPARALRALDAREIAARLSGFAYRWLRAPDVAALLASGGALLRRYGTLERAFVRGLSDDHEDVGPALEAFSASLLEAAPSRPRGLRFLVPSPATGSACKRLCLFLRWVCRPDDGVDLGLWGSVSPARLVIPLDTHIARIARYIGLTRRRSPGWAMAVDITGFLRRLSPDDPLRYDFALCHLGVSGRCPRHRVPSICRECDLHEICTLPRRAERAGPRAVLGGPTTEVAENP